MTLAEVRAFQKHERDKARVNRLLAADAKRNPLAAPPYVLPALEALAQIHQLLDGVEWDSGTACDIAAVMVEAGYVIRNSDEFEA